MDLLFVPRAFRGEQRHVLFEQIPTRLYSIFNNGIGGCKGRGWIVAWTSLETTTYFALPFLRVSGSFQNSPSRFSSSFCIKVTLDGTRILVGE